MNKPLLSWIKQLGTSGEDAIRALAPDKYGNVFVAGYTSGELAEGQQKGRRDAYLAKYNDDGSCQWQLQFGAGGYDVAMALAVDEQGNVYVAGHTTGELVKGQQKGGLDAFLAKYDGGGTRQWVQQLGTVGHDEAFALATDAEGNVFIAGYITGALVEGQQKGGKDAYLAKYDALGNCQWTHQLGTPEADAATALATDNQGNVYMAGHTSGELVADQQKGGRDAFLVKFSSDGSLHWEYQIGTLKYDSAVALATDRQGNVFIAVNTDGEMVPGQWKGGRDIYLAKYDEHGTLQWERQLGSPEHDEATALETDVLGNVYLAGQTSGELAAGQQKGGLDAYLSKFDGDGNLQWELQLGTEEYDYATALAIDPKGNVFIAGNTDGEMVAGQQSGGWDAFLAKYVEAGS